MKDSTRSALLVTVRTLIAAVCVAVVVSARTPVGWANLAIMLAGLAGLLAVLASYNRRWR
ncbi:hypothetical protein AB0I81_26005 [Nonomuraea sp. NPDC050404]|uniref:DUF6903 family protein n=1 Tax=Nonomuraea sp. NPDC050404 TaxID=3155783 RepID=UPI0033D145CF